MKIRVIKYYKKEIQQIFNLYKPIRTKVKNVGLPITGYAITINRRGNEFIHTFIDKTHEYERNKKFTDGYKNILLENSKNSIIVENLQINTYGFPKCEGKIYSFNSSNFPSKKMSYYKMLIPVEKKLNTSYQIQDKFFDTDLGYSTRTGIEININGSTFHFGVISEKMLNSKKHFVSIETNKKIRFDEFAEICYSIKICIGYLTGFFAGNEGYYFSYDNKELKSFNSFKYLRLRPQIKHSYAPINSNPFSYNGINKIVAEKIYKKKLLRPVSFSEISTFCELVYTNKELAHCILLLLESASATLLFMPSGYAIALEMLSDIILKDKEVKIQPIKNKVDFNKVRQELNEVIERNDGLFNDEEKQILLNKINNINQVTNRSRLEMPFIHLGIELSNLDKMVLGYRNALLHGRVPDVLENGTKRSVNRNGKDLYFTALRLQCLVAKVILKWIGYDNYILNFSKIYEKSSGVKIDEPFFIKL